VRGCDVGHGRLGSVGRWLFLCVFCFLAYLAFGHGVGHGSSVSLGAMGDTIPLGGQLETELDPFGL